MDARETLMRLRDGLTPDDAELRAFAMGLADGSVSDAQAGAFAMAVCTRGLPGSGRVTLTQAMRDSGDVLKWDLDRPVLDKHSTGGVGDCVSLILAPALAACGAAVPMISGRGLGHSGGTLDKLEAIPGFRTQVQTDELRQIVHQIGCAIVSASADIAPADKRLYAVRDVTGTVESIDLITASILSKKLAAGLEGLVLDVKVGSGAFMKTADDARELAQSLVTTANGAGCRTSALITDMSQPLASNLGNALELASVMRVLSADAQDRLLQVTLALGAELLAQAEIYEDAQSASDALKRTIADGTAAEVFGRMIAAQGGPVDFVESWQRYLPAAPVTMAVPAPVSGYVAGWDGVTLGMAVVHLGGGRQVETDQIDPTVGLENVAPLGTRVQAGDPVAVIHAADRSQAEVAVSRVQKAITINEVAPVQPLLIHERIT
ncbi:thymidine phosphorylase [Thalassovita sp.]|jgi:thymidine phosphorylase|uniref:thymidine phosphorylase n=1 Tax=Thalassovita sp. TaxID=1979401 RepID=UPI003B5A0C63